MSFPIKDLNIAPYYDNTDQELSKGYHKFLAREGQVLQNRELNVAQGLIYGNLKRINDIIIEDGSIVSGCNFVNDVNTEICTLSDGQVYINGLIVNVEATDFPYATVTEDVAYVCLIIEKVVYTEIDDPALYDPAENIENYGTRGGHRLKYELTPVILTETEMATESETSEIVNIIKIYNRNVIGPTKPKPLFGKIRSYMADKTYDAEGDFIAKGLKVTTSFNENNNFLYDIRISNGKAYLKGYDYIYENETILSTNGAYDYNSYENYPPEIKTFSSSNYKYYLNNLNLRRIVSITGKVETTNVSMSYSGSEDDISSQYTPTVSVSNVNDGVTTYVEGVDFNLINNKIVWIGSHPAGTYYIDIQYSYSFIKSVDYTDSLDSLGNYILFTGTGKLPVDESDFNITYEWYLNRIDLVYIKSDGTITIKNGLPGELSEIKIPNLPLNCLPLAYIYVTPNISPENFSVYSYNIYRVPTSIVQNMKKRLDNVEYSISMNRLEIQAENYHTSRESLTTLKNIYVDGFVTYDQSDISNVNFDSTINIFDENIELPMIVEHLGGNSEIIFTKDDESAIPSHGLLMLPYTSTEVDWQRKATHYTDIAPYYYKGLIPTILCSPKNSTKIYNTEDVKIIWLPNRVIYSTKTVSGWTSNVPGNLYSTTTSTARSGNTQTTTTTRTMRTSTIIDEEIVSTKKEALEKVSLPYIDPELIITINAKDFEPNRNVQLIMENQIVFAWVTDESTATNSSDYPGAITTDSDGAFIAQFRVPPNTTVGTKLVTAETIIELGEDPDYYKYDTDTFTSDSFSQHWLVTIEQRKVETIDDVVYVDKVTSTIAYSSSGGSSGGGGGTVQGYDRDFDGICETRGTNPNFPSGEYMGPATKSASRAQSDADMSSGSAGGGKVICAKLYELGYIDKDLFTYDELYGDYLRFNKPDIYIGYRKWADVVVKYMTDTHINFMFWIKDKNLRKEKEIEFIRKHTFKISEPWCKHMAYEMNYLKKDNRAGRYISKFGAVFSKLINKFTNKRFKPESKSAAICILIISVIPWILSHVKGD